MSAQSFFSASNVLVVAGKGGVGKTTVGAAIAFAAASSGCDVLLIELEGYSSLDHLGAESLSHDPQPVAQELLADGGGTLKVMQLRPDEALADYLDRSGMGPIIGMFSRTGAVEVVVAAAPGLRDVVPGGARRRLQQRGAADLIVVDAPASGHALSFLTSAAGMADSASGGPIREQADQVLDMLSDESRCRVILVTLPEETPVSEVVETAFRIEDEVGAQLGPVVVNGLWPELEGLAEAAERASADPGDEADLAAARFRLIRTADQHTQVERLAAELPLPQIHLPQLFTAAVDLDDIADLAGVFAMSPVLSGDVAGT